MSQQEFKNNAEQQAGADSGSNGPENTGTSIPQNEWTARFDEQQKASGQEQSQQRGQEAQMENNSEKPKSAAQGAIPLPKVDFSTFILSLASSALVQLGEVPNPETGQSEENLLLAKHTIDIISMLQEKTSNGLSAEESRLVEGVLYELRMKYVIKSR